MKDTVRDSARNAGRGSGLRWAIAAVLLAAAGVYLWTEHQAHLLALFPLTLALACPLMHLFHHRGHGAHGHGHDAAPPRPGEPPRESGGA